MIVKETYYEQVIYLITRKGTHSFTWAIPFSSTGIKKEEIIPKR